MCSNIKEIWLIINTWVIQGEHLNPYIIYIILLNLHIIHKTGLDLKKKFNAQ